jgi:predicted NBD/HSP70 family sugar kinase
VFCRVCSNKLPPQRLEMCVTTRTTAWAGIDIGKTHHWICAVDADGRALVSVKVPNVEADIVAALTKVTDLADHVVWAVGSTPVAITPPSRSQNSS